MTWTAVGANLATMLTGLSIFYAAGVWLRNQRRERKEQHAATERRNWSGYIDLGGLNTWRVRLIEDPSEPTSRVVLEVVKDDGEPNPNWAHNLRQQIIRDEMLARVPTEEEYDFLKALHRERGYGKGQAVR